MTTETEALVRIIGFYTSLTFAIVFILFMAITLSVANYQYKRNKKIIREARRLKKFHITGEKS